MTPVRCPAGRVCRVQPDVPAVHRSFDYLVPDELGAHLRVGSVVRVTLHGRRVRGWVLDADIAPERADPVAPGRLQPLRAVSSDGPPADVVALCAWAARHWAGPLVAFLRAATPPNVVAPGPEPEVDTAVYPSVLEPDHAWAHDALVVVAPTRRFALRSLVAAEGSSLVLVPGVDDAARVVRSLRDDGRDVVELTSGRSDAELTRAWRRAREGACVVVGGRAAVWAPVPDLATVLVVDEGDEAYDDERAPTWNARDVAIERARRSGASVRLVTPAPTVEALVAVGEPVPSSTGARRGGWPRVDVVDVRDQEPGQSLLTRELADALHHALGRGDRAVCVLNRRGRARLLACRTCGELATCERCRASVREVDTPLVAARGAASVAARNTGLECPVCATRRPTVCLHCHGTRFRPVKPGVARVRDDLAALLPRVDVGMVDATSAERRDAPVVIGTEAALHRVRGGVGLVAYLELDQELLAPLVRAAEQALWLLVRGARLVAGGPEGASRHGRLLLQTRVPDHAVVRAVVGGDTVALARTERDQRRALGFPPFGGAAVLSGDPAAVGAACDALSVQGVTVLGPVDHGRRAAQARSRLAAQARSRRALVRAPTWDALVDALGAPGVDAARSRGRLRIDVDPRRA